ncbi:MAG: ferritin [Candidatus Muirbacterium halophilum]|nr:ferritin [Candidatus Muirbacterium halophilum]MCK9474836.1 ferritin [Candidatus Muirbacterium halophilum]
MLSKKMEKAINDQINAELFSAYLYLSMSAYFAQKGLPGFASWMHVQYQEETFHAEKFFNHILERGGSIELQPIEKPVNTWKDTMHVFTETLKHEEYVTKRINDLVDLAIKEKDHASNSFLQWYVNEQVEEEDSVNDIINKLNLIGNQAGNLFMLDKEMGNRVFTPPTAV